MPFLANLALAELAALAAGLSGLVVALYLLDRSRRRQTVPTLRFWVAAAQALERRRRRIRQWRSLLMQLAGMLLLLLALAQLRWGDPAAAAARDHVLILDTSAWMGARTERGTLLDQARAAAQGWLRALPAGDRVLLVRADALATPATTFEPDRRVLEQALAASQPGATALNLAQALEFARQAQRLQGSASGEIVFAGTGRVSGEQAEAALPPVPNLRVLQVHGALANCGIRKIGLRRSPTDPAGWEALVGVRNYGDHLYRVPLVLAFGGAVVGTRRLEIPGGAEQDAAFEFRTRAAGLLEARLLVQDAFPGDDRGVLELPAQRAVKVIVYSGEPDLLRPALAANPRVSAEFRRPSEYRPEASADILILDRFRPQPPPAGDTIWIEPPPGASPVRVRATAGNLALTRWQSEHPLAESLRARDLRLASAQIFEPAPGDIAVAETEAGPVVVAREGKPRMVALGFHPGRGALRQELAAPLLFANLLRWLRPELFRGWELNAGAAGAVSLPLGAESSLDGLRVLAEDLSPLPFSVQGRQVRFFAGTPGTVRVLEGDRERVFSLTLPEVAEANWTPPPGARRGVPPAVSLPTAFTELWPWLAALGGVVLAFEWRLYGQRQKRRGASLLKLAMLAAILVALLQPRLTVFESKTAVAVLVDTSASVTPEDLRRASELVGRMARARGRNSLAVLPFARATRELETAGRAGTASLKYTAGEAGRATNLEAAIREGFAALPAGRVPRLALVTDARENLGSAVRAAWQARRLGVPIDTFPVPGRPKPALRFEAASLPPQAFTGERFPVDLAVIAPRRTSATVEIATGEKILGTNPVTLEAGSNRLRVHARVNTVGAIDLAGTVRAPELGEVRFAQSVTLRRPRVLFLSQDPPGAESHLFQTLQAAEFDLRMSATGAAENLDDYQVVVLNNWNLEAVPPVQRKRIEEYVRQGGGLLVIGGERNIYTEKKPADDPLDRVLPATLAPPRTPEGACVVLIVDKSSSMEGRKIELARQSAIGVVENLRPIDLIGVLIFDNSFQWAVPIRRAEERTLIKRILAGIIADGGTQIAPALAEAYRRIRPVNALYKHIVLLTDGISEEGDSLALAKEAAGNQVTISTVGLGQDVNRAYLEKVAAVARGRAYFLTDPSGLEQILLRDVKEHTGTTVVEKGFQPLVAKKAEILEGVGMETAPPLEGYVRYTSKPSADLLLMAEKKDPLLVRWQYGLGRAAVFTSDAKSRWAARWVTWPGFDRFWANLFRDLLPHAQAGEATAEYSSASGELIVEYRLARHLEQPARVPDIFVFGPGGFQRPLRLEKVAEGFFRGRARIEDRQGLFRGRPLEDSRAFPEVGLYRQEPELAEYGADEALLRRIAEFTGGRFNPSPEAVFDPAGRALPTPLRLWPGLLGLSLLLNLAELLWRKWPISWRTL